MVLVGFGWFCLVFGWFWLFLVGFGLFWFVFFRFWLVLVGLGWFWLAFCRFLVGFWLVGRVAGGLPGCPVLWLAGCRLAGYLADWLAG